MMLKSVTSTTLTISTVLFPPYTPTIRPPPYIFNRVQIFFSTFLGQKNVPHRTPHSFSHRTFPQNSPHRTFLSDFIFFGFLGWNRNCAPPYAPPFTPTVLPHKSRPTVLCWKIFRNSRPRFFENLGSQSGPHRTPHIFSHRTFPRNSPHRTFLRDSVFEVLRRNRDSRLSQNNFLSASSSFVKFTWNF